MEYREILEVLKWTSHACDRYWRTIYGNGIWLTRETARRIIRDGWAFSVAWLLRGGSQNGPWEKVVFSPILMQLISRWTQDGYSTLASLTSKKKLRLFKMRPKLHMFCHLQSLISTIQYDYLFAVSHSALTYDFVLNARMLKQFLLEYKNADFDVGPRLDLQKMLSDPECKHLLSPAVHMTWIDEDFIGRIARICRRTHALTAPSRCLDRALGHYRRQWSSVFGPNYLHRWELGRKNGFVLSSIMLYSLFDSNVSRAFWGFETFSWYRRESTYIERFFLLSKFVYQLDL